MVAGLVVLAAFGGCDLLYSLLGTDKTPPTCQVTSPADSSTVNGVVQIAATASDSVGVERTEFYADGSLVGTDSSAPYSASWDASGQTDGSWHSLSCIAYDAAENKGYSDTIAVEIGAAGQRSVYHGELDVAAHAREQVRFVAADGDTLTGDVQVISGNQLSIFMWLDENNYQKYVANQSYTQIYRSDNITQASVLPAVVSAGTYHLVFVNNASAVVKCWVRFVLE